MARRKQLQNIAAGLLGSFVSRNNDVGGYWGIGLLCDLAERSQSHGVQIDLVKGTAAPTSAIFDKLISGYALRLTHHLNVQGIPRNWIQGVTIDLNFDAEPPLDQKVPVSTWGKLYSTTVNIVDDNGKAHVVKAYGYCAPHNSMKESRSGGTERY